MSAVQLQAHSTGSPENSDTMSRSDVTLQDAAAGKTSSFAPHSPVLAKDDEDTHNTAGGAAGHDAAAPSGDSEDGTPKGFWSWLCCCVLQKSNKKDTAGYDKKDGGANNKQNGKSEVPLAQATKQTAASSAANGNDQSKTADANAGGGGGIASLATQVSADQQPPTVMPTVVYPPRAGPTKCLLGPLTDAEKGKKTLVLDLDETLVHSSFKPIPNADFVISIELENVIHRVFVLKRPGVDAFLRAVGAKFEVVVFTASLAKYADPLLDILDRNKVVKTRLFREACVHHYGNYVKDLSHLGRRLEDTIIIYNSPFSYMFQPDNAIPITSWFNDKNDRQLYDLLPFLDQLSSVDDVCTLLHRKKQQMQAGNMA